MWGGDTLAHTGRTLWLPATLSGLVAGIAFAASALGSAALEERITTGLVLMVVVVGLYIFIGNSGVVSFGHISFMAVGGYTFGWMTIPSIAKEFLLPALPGFIQSLELHTVPATIIAGVCALLFAALIGWPLMRLSGIPAAIAMFAVLIVVNVVISQSYEITRGQQALVGIPLATSMLGALAWVAVAIFAAAWFQSTRSGLRLRCSREDEFSAKAIGISIPRERMIALMASAYFVGVGGALFGALLGSLTPQSFFIQMTFTTIVMLVVGGMRSLTGAVVGTMTVFFVSEVLRDLENGFQLASLDVPARPGLQLLGVSLLALLILVFRPSGITGGKEIPFPSWRLLEVARLPLRSVRRESPKREAAARAEAAAPSGEESPPDARPPRNPRSTS